MASCTKRQEALPFVDSNGQTDSTTLSVAVLPTFSCMPVYYAQRMGMFDSAGVKVRLLRYDAQMDVDTCIQRGHVQLAISDPIRAIRLGNDSLTVSPLMLACEPLAMMAQKGKRVKKMQQMKEKMVAVSRLSVTDYWCQRMVGEGNLDISRLYRPQVNDIFLRTDMLLNGLIDAAMLPEPYAAWAAKAGNKCIAQAKGENGYNALWVAVSSGDGQHGRDDQIRKFAKVYRSALSRMTAVPQADTLRSILVKEYKLPPVMADSLQLPEMKTPRALTEADLKQFADWLHEQERLPAGFSVQEFLSHQIK